jgi:hypothetical protein
MATTIGMTMRVIFNNRQFSSVLLWGEERIPLVAKMLTAFGVTEISDLTLK